MVGCHFCKRALERGLLERFELAIFGEEPNPAYDRVNLGRLLEGAALEELILEPRDWYERHGMQAHFGARVLRIDRDERVVETEGKGCHASYRR